MCAFELKLYVFPDHDLKNKSKIRFVKSSSCYSWLITLNF